MSFYHEMQDYDKRTTLVFNEFEKLSKMDGLDKDAQEKLARLCFMALFIEDSDDSIDARKFVVDHLLRVQNPLFKERLVDALQENVLNLSDDTLVAKNAPKDKRYVARLNSVLLLKEIGQREPSLRVNHIEAFVKHVVDTDPSPLVVEAVKGLLTGESRKKQPYRRRLFIGL